MTGIDFGYAFGAGVECTRIPELIPFRMTPHIKSIMAPMYLTGWLVILFTLYFNQKNIGTFIKLCGKSKLENYVKF